MDGSSSAARPPRPRSSGALLLGLALVLLAGVALAWWWAGRPQPTPWDSVSFSGQDVTVQYVGSDCEDSARLEIDEDEDEVVLTVHAGSHALSCSDVGVPREVSGRLEEPIGVRDVFDGACRLAKFSNYLACSGR